MKKITAFIICAVLCLSLVACGYNGNTEFNLSNGEAEVEPNETINEHNEETNQNIMEWLEYKVLVAGLNDEIYTLSVMLNNMGNYQIKFWEAIISLGGGVNFTSLIESAYDWLERNGDYTQEQMESDFNYIANQYKEFVIINVTDLIALDARNYLIDLYNSFLSLYALVTSPAGSISNFTNNFDEYVRNIINLNNSLSVLVS
ncbi:MAG: hypothetical protein LBD23_18185 [Oscillospiraceae bacterium]|jgi:hypothetical protein|nr:hypothetical protein [Oscillospiraceae bacterium]